MPAGTVNIVFCGCNMTIGLTKDLGYLVMQFLGPATAGQGGTGNRLFLELSC